MNELRTMHLFAGHGGGLLADLILGHKPVVAVEWDKYACQVLRERAADGWFPGLRVWEGDVRLFDPSEYAGKVDCIHAGFPCQDISVAGKQAGVSEGTRSGLYREVLRIAGVVRPRQLFLENVSAILSNGLGTVLGDLAALGYESKWCCLRASDVGANHQRDRWWLLADSSQVGRFSTVWNENNGEKRIRGKTEKWGNYWKPTDLGQKGSTLGKWWANKPKPYGMDDGNAGWVERLAGMGNAQCPLQAATAYRLLGGHE